MADDDGNILTWDAEWLTWKSVLIDAVWGYLASGGNVIWAWDQVDKPCDWRRWYRGGTALLPWPGWLHDWNLHLWEASSATITQWRNYFSCQLRESKDEVHCQRSATRWFQQDFPSHASSLSSLHLLHFHFHYLLEVAATSPYRMNLRMCI